MEWEQRAARCLRVEMARGGVNFPELARRMSAVGRPVSPQSLRNKLSRGSFSAAFFLEALSALNCRCLNL